MKYNENSFHHTSDNIFFSLINGEIKDMPNTFKPSSTGKVHGFDKNCNYTTLISCVSPYITKKESDSLQLFKEKVQNGLNDKKEVEKYQTLVECIIKARCQLTFLIFTVDIDSDY